MFFETTNEVFELRNLLVANHQLVTLILDGGQERVEFIVFNVLRIEIVDTRDEVAQNVHIIGESIVGGSVDAAITAITAGFGGDEAEVVGRLEIVPVLEQTLVASNAHAIGHRVEFFESFLLHHVAEPRREVALFVYPSGGIFHHQRTNALDVVADFGRCGEGDAALTELFGERFEKLEDVAGEWLEHTQGAKLHKEVHHRFIGRLLSNPVGISFGKEGIFAPRVVVEAIADVFGERWIAEEEFEFGIAAAVIDKVRTLPAQCLFGTFGKHAFETHIGHEFADFVGIHKARVAEHLGRFAKKTLDFLAHALHFLTEALRALDGRETVAVRFGEEFHATRLIEFVEKFKHLGAVLFEEFDGRARERERAFEIVAIAMCHFNECL